jgi:hypothetical protein
VRTLKSEGEFSVRQGLTMRVSFVEFVSEPDVPVTVMVLLVGLGGGGLLEEPPPPQEMEGFEGLITDARSS